MSLLKGSACNYQFSVIVADVAFRWSVCLGIHLGHRHRDGCCGQQQPFPPGSPTKSSQQPFPVFIPQQQALTQKGDDKYDPPPRVFISSEILIACKSK